MNRYIDQELFCLSLQLGGTIGDIEGMPFVEAFRQFQFRAKRENFACVHVSLIPQVGLTLSNFRTDKSVRKGRPAVTFVRIYPYTDFAIEMGRFEWRLKDTLRYLYHELCT